MSFHVSVFYYSSTTSARMFLFILNHFSKEIEELKSFMFSASLQIFSLRNLT